MTIALSRTTTLLWSLLITGFLACQSEPATTPDNTSGQAPTTTAPTAVSTDTQQTTATDPPPPRPEEPFVKRDATQLIANLERLAPSLPKQVFLLLVLESSPLTEAFLDASSGLFLDNLDKKALTSDLGTLLRAHIGLDLKTNSPLVVAIAPDGWFALFTFGKLSVPEKATPEQIGDLTALRIRKESLFRVHLEDAGATGIFFKREHVEVLDATRKNPGLLALAGTPELNTLTSLLNHTGVGHITLTGQFHDSALATRLFDRLPIDPLLGLGLSFDQRILATATGSQSAINKLKVLFTLGKMQIATRLNRRIKTLPDAPFFEALSTVLGFHLLNAWSTALHPKSDDTNVHLNMPGLGPAESLALVGLFAAVVLLTLLEKPSAP